MIFIHASIRETSKKPEFRSTVQSECPEQHGIIADSVFGAGLARNSLSRHREKHLDIGNWLFRGTSVAICEGLKQENATQFK